jgi:hypothetical protein
MSRIVLSIEEYQKLAVLEEHMPNEEEFIYEFGKILAGNVYPCMSSEAFIFAASLASWKYPARLDNDMKIHSFLEAVIPKIAAAVASKEFTEEFCKISEKVFKTAS